MAKSECYPLALGLHGRNGPYPVKVILLLIITVVSCLVFASTGISPGAYPAVGFIGFLIPAFLLLNCTLVLFLLMRKSWKVLFPVLALFFGWDEMRSTVAFHFGRGENVANLRVMSFNVRVFNVYAHLRDKDYKSSKEMMQWVAEFPAEIKCFQEVYQSDGSEYFDLIANMRRHGYGNYHFLPFLTNKSNAKFGMAIFTKYPIIGRGVVNQQENSNNQIIYADIATETDTVRVYNMHLQSIALNEDIFIDNLFERNDEGQFEKDLGRIRSGLERRSIQVDEGLRHMRESPYPVIAMGDLNDPPYSYAYRSFMQLLDNAFEMAGNGLGFTYNGRLFFLRIDNIFVSKGIDVTRFDVEREMRYSDHFPVSADLRLY